MAVADVFKVYLYPDPIAILNEDSPEDITSGIINVDIVTGSDQYEGPQQQIDTGQFTIVSRNPNLDPKINTNLKYNSGIAFVDERTGEFFRGYVTNVDVQYQRKDDPIITITGTDIFGVLRRTVVNEDLYNEIIALSTGSSWNGVTFEEFVGLESFVNLFSSRYLVVDDIGAGNSVSPGFKFYVASKEGQTGLDTNQIPITNNLGFAPAKYIPQLGENLLDIINYYATTNLNSIYPKSDFGFWFISVFPFVKYNGFYWPPQQDPALSFPTYQFSSDPADGRPYRSILIDNGFNNVTNQIDISNQYRFIQSGEIKSQSDNFGPYVSQESFDDYAVSKASISTLFPDDDPETLDSLSENYAKNIFQVVGFPTDQVQRIEFDNARYEDIENDFTYSDYVVGNFIRIKHQVNETETIDRFYDIAGITHSISPDDWTMSFSFKPSQQEIAFNYQGQPPTLQMNALSGDANFNFTATIVDFPLETIDNVIWDLNQKDANEETYYYRSATTGEKFKNNTVRTGLTQTWNFDDDGILAAYDFETNPFGGYGPGFWWVTAYITLTNGFTIVVQQGLTVGTPAVTANFGWTQNLTNNFGQVTFTNTSTNHETGEPDSYAWDFGDGNTSSQENPIHVYDPSPSTTTYSVSLTVFAYGEGGTKVYNTHTETVTLAQPTMTANFTSSASGSTVTFTNTSTNVGFEEPDAYFWDFGDDTSSTLKNPVKTYAGAATVSLTFSVTLTTRNIWEQTATVTKSVTIAPLFDTGTVPVNEVRLVRAESVNPTTPIMSYLKCLRSDGSNLSFNTTTTRANEPDQLWWQSNGTVAPLSGTNLTRNPALYPNIYGLQFRSGTPSEFSLNTTIPSTFNIDSIKMLFDDKFPAATRISLWDRYYITINDSFGGFYPVGYYDLPPIPNYAPRQSFGREYTMTPIRPMPPSIPYFKYTFNNRTVSFTSVETADSYAWTFGDGTTSTLKNPVKTYAAKGTYNVTLAVTNGGVVTRTTTEPVIVETLNGSPVRYVKFAQKLHTGTHAFDTPTFANLYPIFNKNKYVQTTPQADFYVDPRNIAKAQTYSMDFTQGTAGTPVIDPITAPKNKTTNYVRVKSLDGTFRTKFELVADFVTPVNNLTGFSIDLTRWPADGAPATAATGISYEMFITDYVGAPAGIAGATWTKVGDFNPTNIPTTVEERYFMTPL